MSARRFSLMGAVLNLQRHLEGIPQVKERSDIEVALRQMIDNAAGFEQQLGRAERERRSARAEAQRQAELALARLRDLETVRAELQFLRRKYRSTQNRLDHERDRQKNMKRQLRSAEMALASYETSLPRRLQQRVDDIKRAARRFPSRLSRKSGRKADQRALSMLKQSLLFDQEWYLRTYRDVAENGTDPIRHYLEFGWKEGRDPGPSFSTTAYLRANPDVARAGINPLLHLIEHGHSEGRGTFNSRLVARSIVTDVRDFESAAPCASFALVEETPVRWTRTFRLLTNDVRLIFIGGLAVGYEEDAQLATWVKAEFRWLAAISGFGDEAAAINPDRCEEGELSSPTLLDGWYVTQGRLRTRWRAKSYSFVVRAYQHDPSAGGALQLAGEGVILSPLDFVDVNLANPYFPILFVISSNDGSVRAARLLAFPSLCRGGVHYAEFLLLSRSQSKEALPQLDPVAQSESLGTRLAAFTDGADPLVGTLFVSLAGSDGTEPLFQPDFRAWLSHVIQIGIQPANDIGRGDSQAFLLNTLELASSGRRSRSDAALVLASNMVPTISVLLAHEVEQSCIESCALAVLVAGADPAQPATLIVPPSRPVPAEPSLRDFPAAWPRFVASREGDTPKDVPAAAIRLEKRLPIHESELLVPVMDGLTVDLQPKPITWLILPQQWSLQTFSQAVDALAQQLGSEHHGIALVGSSLPQNIFVAERSFPHRTSSYPDLKSAVQSATTPLVGYLGSGVILHDSRCSALLSFYLQNPSVESASCVLVTVEKQGKGWLVAVTDFGELEVASETYAAAVTMPKPEVLWRTAYPVTRPPAHYWVARKASVLDWLRSQGAQRDSEGVHLCTSIITATQLSEAAVGAPGIQTPASPGTRVEVLFG